MNKNRSFSIKCGWNIFCSIQVSSYIKCTGNDQTHYGTRLILQKKNTDGFASSYRFMPDLRFLPRWSHPEPFQGIIRERGVVREQHIYVVGKNFWPFLIMPKCLSLKKKPGKCSKVSLFLPIAILILPLRHVTDFPKLATTAQNSKLRSWPASSRAGVTITWHWHHSSCPPLHYAKFFWSNMTDICIDICKKHEEVAS